MRCGSHIGPMDEIIPFQTDPLGPICVLKCCITPPGDILWPTKPFFSVAFADSNRQYLNIIDKAQGALQTLYAEVFGDGEKPPLVAPSSDNYPIFPRISKLLFKLKRVPSHNPAMCSCARYVANKGIDMGGMHLSSFPMTCWTTCSLI